MTNKNIAPFGKQLHAEKHLHKTLPTIIIGLH